MTTFAATPLANRLFANAAREQGLYYRFDALALIREKGIVSALPSLESLLVILHGSDAPGASYEADRVRSVVTLLLTRTGLAALRASGPPLRAGPLWVS